MTKIWKVDGGKEAMELMYRMFPPEVLEFVKPKEEVEAKKDKKQFVQLQRFWILSQYLQKCCRIIRQTLAFAVSRTTR